MQLFTQYTRFFDLLQYNSHIVYVSFLDEAPATRYHDYVKNSIPRPPRTAAGGFSKGDDERFMNWLRKVMYGRYGGDQLSMFLVGVYLVLYLLSLLPHMGGLSWLATLIIVVALYRCLSHRIDRRRAENVKFLELFGPVIRYFRLLHTMHKDKDHRYFKCPNCGQRLRVPKGKGKITITCRNCGVSFEEKC